MSTDLLTIQEAARTLRMSVRTLKKLAKNEAVPCVALPDGEYRFREPELAEWVEAHRQGPVQEKRPSANSA